MNTEQRALIRGLNDDLRKHHLGGKILISAGVSANGPSFVMGAIAAIAGSDSFTEDNDPWGEHDFGLVEVLGAKVFWKIDYYNGTLTAGADDPSDAKTCVRVLTVMLAHEY